MTIPAVVLAGERPGGSPLAQAFDQPAGVLVEVAGRPCIERTIAALEESESIHGGLICGPDPATRATSPAIRRLLDQTDFRWLPPATGPAQSALISLEELNHRPALLTAADHALLTPEIVDNFTNLAVLTDADFIVGFVPYSIVREAFPESRRTVLKFSDGQFCGSNLYLIRTDHGTRLLKLWQTIQQHRKQPWRMAKEIGFKTLFGYLTRTLKLKDALEAIGERAGCTIGYVEILNPRAAVDVDSLADHALAEKILNE